MTWATFEDYCASGVTVPLSMSKSHFGAYRKGVAARLAGDPPGTCPYFDGTMAGARWHWQASLYAWMAGWRDKDADLGRGAMPTHAAGPGGPTEATMAVFNGSGPIAAATLRAEQAERRADLLVSQWERVRCETWACIRARADAGYDHAIKSVPEEFHEFVCDVLVGELRALGYTAELMRLELGHPWQMQVAWNANTCALTEG